MGGCSSPCCYPLVVAAPPTGYGHLLALGCLAGRFGVVADLLPWGCGLWLAWTSLLHWGSTDCAQAPSSDCAGMAGLCQGQLRSVSGSLVLLPFSCGPPSSLNQGGHTLDFQHSWATGWGLPLSVSGPQGTLCAVSHPHYQVRFMTNTHAQALTFFLSLSVSHRHSHTRKIVCVHLGKANVFGTTKHLDHDSGC